jgi:copper chaperone CopZ
MSEKTNIKEIKLETLTQARRKKNIGNIKKIFFALAIIIIAAGAGIGAYRVMAGPVVTARFAVAKMNCPACIITVKEAAKSLPGVTDADISLAAQEVYVFFKHKQIHPDEIARTISSTGYPARLDAVFNPGQTKKQNPAIAIVNNRPVFKSDMDQPPGFEGFTGKSCNTAEAFFNTVGKKILLLTADNQNVVVQPSEIQPEIEKFRLQKSLSPEEFKQIAEKSYGSLTELNQAVAQKIAMTKMIQESVPYEIEDTEEKKRQILARIGIIFNRSDVKVLYPDLEKKLQSDAGYSDWKTFWPQMVSKKTWLMAVIDEIANNNFHAEYQNL